ncbi:MAG TPA: hypothetical protein VHH88_06380 [Verrucomicrobiae bacterium]|nr:hypothetical protein [Verrucomicrobiae bacterium]
MNSRKTGITRRANLSRSGSAMIVVLILISILLIYILANAQTLNHLGRELRLLDQKQTRRLLTAGKRAGTSSDMQTRTPEPTHAP